MKKFLLSMLLLLLGTAAWSQDRVVTGRVSSVDDQQPLPGVNVIVQGTTKGTTTDAEGRYSIQLAASETTLVFSFVGYNTMTISVDNRNVIDVALEGDVTSLSEVVVVGYGTQREKDLTSAITSIKSDELIKTPSGTALQALQGKIAGVQVVSSGAPGSSPTIRVRGIGSFPGSGNNNEAPLYVVDGMFFDNIDFLNPSDIAKISVFKDASASAIYGVRAAQGVIVIETKGGSFEQKAQITYDGYYGTQVAQNVLKMANAEQFTTMALESGSIPDANFINNAMQRYGRSRVNPNVPNVNTDWYDQILRPAQIQNHSFGISGGSKTATYSVGANYFSQDGILDMKNNYERFNIRTKLDYEANDWLNVGANFILSNATNNTPNGSVWNEAYFAVPILPVYDDLNTVGTPIRFANAQNIGYRSGQNPFPTMTYNSNQQKIRKLLTNFYVKLNFLEDKLTFQSTYNNGLTFLNTRNINLPFFLGDGFQNPQSGITRRNENYINHIWDNVVTYNNNFGAHNLTVMAGTSFRDEGYEMLTARGLSFPVDNEESWYIDKSNRATIPIDAVRDDGSRLYGISYFGRVAYNFADKYLVYGTLRADGTSKYQEKWDVFPAIGAGWVISEENFMQDISAISFLKLRAGWGVLGNDKIRESDGARTTDPLSTAINNQLVFGTLTRNNFSALSWESTEELNLGITTRFLNDRLSFEADYYIRDTKDAVISVVPPIQSAVLRQVGIIRNKGFEVSLGWNDELSNGLRYYINGNLGILKNSVQDLYGQPYINSGQAEFLQRSFVGEPIMGFFGYKVAGVYQNNEEVQADPIAVANGLVPGDFKYVDQNNDGVMDDKDRIILGSYIPTFNYGMSMGVTFKNFDLSASIMGQTGNKILNRKRGEIIWTADGNMDADLATNRWHGEGTSNKYPSAAGLRKGWNQKMSDYFVEDGSFFRIQNVTLGYNIRQKELFGVRMPDARVTLTAERPLTVFQYNGFNPEVANGIDTQTYPIPAVYTIGLNVKL